MASKRRKQCQGKVRHKTLGAAWKHTKSLRSRNLDKSRMFARPYKCEFCGGFHIGHTTRKMRQAMYQRKYEN